jgi:tripartite-type tricarboxylate transporter receptor subunit TctC
MHDPEFIARVNKSKLVLQPSTGEELQALVERIMNQPREVIERVKKILNE